MPRLRSLWWLLLLALTFALAACGSSDGNSGGGETDQKAQVPPTPKIVDGKVDTTPYRKEPPYVIGVSNVSVANSWRVQMIEEFRQVAKENPEIKDIIITDAGGDINKQISDIEDLLAQEVDALIVAPASDTAIAPAVERAYDAGIPVIVFNTDLQSEKVVARVIPPYRAWAKQAAEWLAEQLGGKGKVIALRGIAGLAAEADEWAGVQEVFQKYPDIEVICTEYADWAYDKAKTAMANCLANKPQVDGVASIGDGMTWAAAEVLKARGYDVTKIPMIGIGGSNGFLKYWQQNNLNAYVIADPTSISITALNAALDVLKGKPVEAVQAPETIVIDNSNLDEFVKPSLPDSAWVGTDLSDEALGQILEK